VFTDHYRQNGLQSLVFTDHYRQNGSQSLAFTGYCTQSGSQSLVFSGCCTHSGSQSLVFTGCCTHSGLQSLVFTDHYRQSGLQSLVFTERYRREAYSRSCSVTALVWWHRNTCVHGLCTHALHLKDIYFNIMLHSTHAFTKRSGDFRAVFKVISLRSVFGHSLVVLTKIP
jgi:hypothetical protein